MKRLLVVAYFVPPSAASGALRTVFLARHLPPLGVSVRVLGPEPGRYRRTADYALKVPVARARESYPCAGGNGLLPRLVRRVWKTVALPDEHTLWVKRAVALGLRVIEEWTPDAVFATAHPLSAFAIGAALSERSGLPLVLDYRDPMSGLPVPALEQRWKAPFRKRVERRALARASLVTTATRPMARFVPCGGLPTHPLHYTLDAEVVPQPVPDGTPTLLYAGSFYAGFPLGAVARAVALLRARGTPVRFVYLGEPPRALAPAFADEGAADALHAPGFVLPDEAKRAMHRANVLLLTPAFPAAARELGVFYAGKMFDYIEAGRPILHTSPLDAMAEAVRRSRTGLAVEPTPEGIAEGFAQLASERVEPDYAFLERFRAPVVASGLVAALEEHVF